MVFGFRCDVDIFKQTISAQSINDLRYLKID